MTTRNYLARCGVKESYGATGEAALGFNTPFGQRNPRYGFEKHADIVTVSRLAEVQSGISLKTPTITTTPMVGIDNPLFKEYPFGPRDPEELAESAGILNDVTLRMILGESRMKTPQKHITR